ncbi:MAG: PepSY domain-containing protein [Chitinophagaceae bacterium]|nr:PepSY domain-containing protein [Chitinophagaceae bacterium]
MASKSTMSNTMRIWHRYLGFFLAGIMAVYSISGIVLIFRDTNFLKRETIVEKKLEPEMNAEALGKAIRIKGLKIEAENGDMQTFKGGSYNKATGEVSYTVKTLPKVIEKLTKLHKASTGQPLWYLNVFFGVSLLFFVISSFYMFLPKTSIFKKGLYFTLAGIVLTLLLLYIR